MRKLDVFKAKLHRKLEPKNAGTISICMGNFKLPRDPTAPLTRYFFPKEKKGERLFGSK